MSDLIGSNFEQLELFDLIPDLSGNILVETTIAVSNTVSCLSPHTEFDKSRSHSSNNPIASLEADLVLQESFLSNLNPSQPPDIAFVVSNEICLNDGELTSSADEWMVLATDVATCDDFSDSGDKADNISSSDLVISNSTTTTGNTDGSTDVGDTTDIVTVPLFSDVTFSEVVPHSSVFEVSSSPIEDSSSESLSKTVAESVDPPGIDTVQVYTCLFICEYFV